MIGPREIRQALLAYYDAHRRELPWRDGVSAYATWVSEVMLQQTRVETVRPYYRAWMERFPTVDALADAAESDVLRLWEGLGYYSRARHLHRAARLVRERFAGELPRSAAELRALPGVGEYTAGAVASIAFGEAVPAVDGNVRRVLSRLLDMERPTPGRVRKAAAALVPEERPGDFNQALMELGATICTPSSPACAACPLRARCLAHRRGTVPLRPPPRKRADVPGFDIATAVVVDRDGAVLLRKRPPDGLLGGMWEFPGAPLRTDAARDAAALAARLTGCAVETLPQPSPLEPLSHTFSHRREVYHAYVFGLGVRPECEAPLSWVDPGRLSDYPMPRGQRRIQQRWREQWQQQTAGTQPTSGTGTGTGAPPNPAVKP